LATFWSSDAMFAWMPRTVAWAASRSAAAACVMRWSIAWTCGLLSRRPSEPATSVRRSSWSLRRFCIWKVIAALFAMPVTAARRFRVSRVT
jgi:hypothetical protein